MGDVDGAGSKAADMLDVIVEAGFEVGAVELEGEDEFFGVNGLLKALKMRKDMRRGEVDVAKKERGCLRHLAGVEMGERAADVAEAAAIVTQHAFIHVTRVHA